MLSEISLTKTNTTIPIYVASKEDKGIEPEGRVVVARVWGLREMETRWSKGTDSDSAIIVNEPLLHT